MRLLGIGAAALWLAACGGEEPGSGATAGVGGSAGPTHALVDGVSLTAVDVNQGVRRPLMQNGTAAVSSVPLLSDRPGLLRVFYSVDAAVYNGSPVIARLTFGDAAPLEMAATVAGESLVEDLASTLNFDVSAELLAAGGSYRVELLQAATVASGENVAAGYPASGQEPLPLVTAPTLKLVVVPIQYQADGSGRLPDTSEVELNGLRDAFFSRYPVGEVQISVTAPLPFDSAVGADGTGWDLLLNAVSDFRAQNGAAFDEYYYGMVAPAAGLQAYCPTSCTTGLSLLAVAPTDAFLRAGTGIGFPASYGTALHEVGHLHGRQHAPCGTAAGLDPSYPYAGGVVGTWGFDFIGKNSIDPSVADLMGYCKPSWVSDYTYAALFNRASSLGSAQQSGAGGSHRYQRAMVDGEGRKRWIEPITVEGPIVERFYPYSHLPGGVLLVP